MHSSFTYNPNAHRNSSYQQQSGYQQPIYNIGATQGFNTGFMNHQPSYFVNHSFTRSFASVVSCENDLAKRQQMNNVNMHGNQSSSQNSGIWGTFLRHFKPPQYQQYQPPTTVINQKQFEDFTHMPSLSVNHSLPLHPNHYNQNQHYYQQPPKTVNHINMNFVSDQYGPAPQSANTAPVAPTLMTALFGGYQQPQQPQQPKPRNQWWCKKGFRYRGWRGGRNDHPNRFHDADVILPKNVHEKERSSIERNIQDDSCDFVDVMEDKDVMNQVIMNIEKNNPNKTAKGSCLTTTKSDELPFTIFSLEDFPAIVTTSTKKKPGKKAAPPTKTKHSKEDSDEGFVVVPTNASISTPSFTPKRISVCEKIISSPQRLLNSTMPLIRKSCLKPSRRFERESDCSDDFIVFADECDGEDQQDELFCEGDSDDDSDSDDSDDEMDGIEEEDEDDEMSEDEDDETLEIQIDSGVEEKKVRFNMTPKVHVMRVWDFAYRTYRKGDFWQQMARDHERFRKRICEHQGILAPILRPEHRDKIFRERFQDALLM